MANYGLAGQYTDHYDQVLMGAGRGAVQAREMFNMYAGDRLATVMGYLSHVPAGGYTVFPLIGAYVRSVQNTAKYNWAQYCGTPYILVRDRGKTTGISDNLLT